MESYIVVKDKVKVKLGKTEKLEEKQCPDCGGQLVTDSGAGISCTYCLSCTYNDYDYD